MLLNLQFDAEASKLANKLIFSCEEYELTREDIIQLKKEKIVKYVQEEIFPERVPCQVLMFLENPKEAKMIFYNPNFMLPAETLEDNFLNKDLIEGCTTNGGFRLEIQIPLSKTGVKINFSYETK